MSGVAEAKSRVLTLFLCLFIFLDKIFTGVLIEGGHISEGNILIRSAMDSLGLCVSLILAGVFSTIFAIVIHYAEIDENMKNFIQIGLCLVYSLILLLHCLIIFDVLTQ